MNADDALDAAVIVIEGGGATSLAERTFNSIYGVVAKGSHAPALLGSIWRTDFVLVTIAAAEGELKTLSRRISSIGLSLTRASEAAALGERAGRGELDARAIHSEIARIRKLPAPYGRGAIVLASACAAAFLTQTVAGDYGSMGVSFVAAGFGALFRSFLHGRKLGRSGCMFAAATLSALLGTLGLRMGVTSSVAATLVGSIIYTVPGVSLATGFVDLVSERHMLAGVERILSAAFTFLILALSLVIADALL